MINQILKSPFQLGIDPYPEWLKQIDKSKLNFILRDDGSLKELQILGEKVTTAKVGSIIGLIGDQITILPPAAKQYM